LKLGQFVSARPDLLPEAYVTELSKLQDRVPQAPAAVVKRVIEEDVGPVEELFSSFEADSASAASLAQVHQAVRKDGRKVAVKVQYPKVAAIVPDEMKDTVRLLGLADRFIAGVDLKTIAGALERVILEELDYVNEAANLERFAANFADEPSIVVPGLHRDLSRGRVLVMDWVDGENLGRALREADHETAEEAARLLVDSYLKQILVDGFLHADPHPGNFLLQDGPRLGFVDFGACAKISDATRLGLRDLYRSGLEQDPAMAGRALDALGFRTRSGDVSSLVAWVSLFDSSEVDDNREAAWSRLMAAAREDPVVKIPDELIMVGRVLMVQTGLVARIKPSWSMEELLAARLGPA
jgi:predicted unusual protein kinase regulating ubiquinone biosynthesis (AarF/ABC1/UbiB family)